MRPFLAVCIFLAALAHPVAAGEEKPDAAKFLRILPEALVRLQFGLQSTDPENAGKSFYLGAVSIRTGVLAQPCQLRFFLRNRFNLSTIDNLTLILTSHGETGERVGVHEVVFLYVDPGDIASVNVTLDRPCPDLSYVRPREVTTCRTGVVNLTDCLEVFPDRIDIISLSKAVGAFTTPPEE